MAFILFMIVIALALILWLIFRPGKSYLPKNSNGRRKNTTQGENIYHNEQPFKLRIGCSKR